MANFSPAAPDIYFADPMAKFKDAYATASGIKNEQDAKKALSDYAASLYGKTTQPGAPTLADLASPPPGADSPAADRMIADSHSAATAATDPTLASYFQKLGMSESGGDPNAKNPNSSAGGIYQITDPTWQALVAQNPNSGLTADGKMDPQQQQIAVRLLTAQNAKALGAAGQPINPGTLYAAHFLGAPTATNVLGYADNTPIASVVSPEVIQANPNLQGMSVGDFKQWAGSQGGNGQGGYQPPMAQPSAAPAAAQPTGNGLPPRDVLISLLRNPETRQFGASIIQTAQSGGKLTDDQREYTMAVSQGFKGSFLDYQKALKGTSSSSLINAGNGQLYDPSTKTWISAPTDTASGANLPTVAFNDKGVPDPAQQEAFLGSLDPSTAALIKGVANYQLDPTKVTTLRGDQRQKFVGLVQQYDPTFDMSQYGARAQAKKAYTTGQQGQTITSANTVIGHLSNLADDASKLGNGDFVPFNVVGNAVKSATSDPNLAKFNSDKMAVASELAKFFKGTGATDLTTTQEWQSIFDQNTGPGALKAVVSNVIGNLMKSRLDEMRSQYTSAMGKPSDFRFITPETDAVLQKMGIDTSAIDPSFGGGQAAQAPADAGIDDLLKKYGQ